MLQVKLHKLLNFTTTTKNTALNSRSCSQTPKITFAKTVLKNDKLFQPAGGNRRRYKPAKLVKGTKVDTHIDKLTVEKKIHYCISGFTPGAEEEDVKRLISSFAKTISEVSLVKNKSDNYKVFKMFKVTVGISDKEAITDPLNWHVNLSVRRFRMPRIQPDPKKILISNTNAAQSSNATYVSQTNNQL